MNSSFGSVPRRSNLNQLSARRRGRPGPAPRRAPRAGSRGRGRSRPRGPGRAGAERGGARRPTRRWRLRAGRRTPPLRGSAPGAARTLVERFDRRGIEPFELFTSDFGQNSWNPKKTTKSTVAKKTTSTKQHSTQNTRRGRTNGKKRETNCTEGARRTTLSHRSQRCYTGHQNMLCLKIKR